MSGLNFERAPGHHQRHHRAVARAGRRSESAGAVHRVDADALSTCRPFAAAHPHAAAAAPTSGRASGSATRSPCRRTSTCSSNIACVVGGRRRFTLFPPEQMPNLYIGPIEFTHLGRADQHGAAARTGPRALSAFRRSAAPRAAAPSSSPATRMYIPYGWWHHVESLTPFNVLVNYWWNDARQAGLALRRACCTRRSRCATCRPISARCGARCSSTSYSRSPDESHGAPAARTARHAGPAFRGAHAGDSRHPGERFLAAVIRNHWRARPLET